MSKEAFERGKVEGYKMAIRLVETLEENRDAVKYRWLKSFFIESQHILLSGINYNSETEQDDHEE
jgi:hypothetical protein